MPIIGDLTSTTGMSSSFSGRAGVGGGLDTSSEKNTMLQAGSEGRQGDLTSALNHLLPILLGKTGAAGDLAADLHNSIAVAGSQGSRGDLSSGLSLTALLFGSNTDQAGPAVYEGSLSAVAARLDTELFGATGAAGDLSARIMNAASLIGQLGMTGSATIRLDPVAAMIEGLLGVSGEVAVTLSTGAELAGQLGISGDLVADLEPLGLMLLQIARSEKIYRIVISTQSGRAVLLKPEFGTINISTTIN
ncbi:MAG: hypothetical protein MI862_04895 [Desulfobacterales bacterium]|nr:hypothetical protein [Desulfobacterales bacterium]